MKAIVATRFGPAETLEIRDLPTPVPGPDEILVQVGAASVTTADWRIRAGAFPGMLKLPGHLMFGIRRPRQPVLGTSVAGRVSAVGRNVTRFRPGMRVFGFVGQGGHAQFVLAQQDGAFVETPDTLSDAEAAALPFGGNSALVFLRDVAKLRAGQNVLIVGASGAVGSYAVQIAKAMGADVTAVAGPGRGPFLQSLGADRTVNYMAGNPAATDARYDVVFDTVGKTHWRAMRQVLKPGGVFVPLNFDWRELRHLVLSKLLGGPRIALSVSQDSADDLRELTRMIARGALRPVIDRSFRFDQIAHAYRLVESRHGRGTVILDMAQQEERALCA